MLSQSPRINSSGHISTHKNDEMGIQNGPKILFPKTGITHQQQL